MTDSKRVIECKRRIKIVIGSEGYLDFIQRLANSIDPLMDLERRYGISCNVLRSWIDVLGYRDSTTRRCLKMHYKRLERIKTRELNSEKLTKFLLSNVVSSSRR